MQKMLFVCSRLPYPPIGGDRAKNYNLLKKLSLHFDIHVVVITSEVLSTEASEFLDSIGSYKVFKKTRFNFLISFLKGVFSLPRPLQVSLYKFGDVQKYINSIVDDIDIIFTTLVRTSEYAVNVSKPKFCDMADSIGQNYARSYKTVKSSVLKVYYFIESKLLIRYENKIAQSFDKVFLFNQAEIDNFEFKKGLVWIPHGVNERLLEYEIPLNKEEAVGFLGKMDYQPNVDAVVWFCENVLPILNPSIKFYIIGANPTDRVKALASSRVIVTGFLDDPFVKLGSLKLAIAPMISGGGIQNKVLESLALGVANVVSPLAAKPMMKLEKNKVLLIANEVDDWKKIIERLMLDDALRARYENEGRQYIVDNYTWSAAASIYIHNINTVIEVNNDSCAQ